MDFSKLFSTYFTISDLYAERQSGPPDAYFEMANPRPTDAFLLFTGSSAICSQKSKTPFYVPHGALVYIPRGCTYTWESHAIDNKSNTETMLFEFTLHETEIMYGNKNEISVGASNKEYISFKTDEITILDFRPKLYERLFASLIDEFEAKNPSPISIYRAAYAVFEGLRQSMLVKSKDLTAGIADTAMFYLGNAEFFEKSIADIASLCCTSISGLEKQFRHIMGISPIEYRLECKIAQVKKLLLQSSMSLSEIAEQCGFSDSTYLCRIFKKKIGITPHSFAKQAKQQQIN